MNNIKLLTDRLTLRLVTYTDLQSVHDLHVLPETDQYNTLGIPKNINETESIVNTWVIDHQKSEVTNLTFVIERQTDQKFIGLIALKIGSKKFKSAEVWHKLHSNYWRKGYATESLKKVITFGFDTLKFHRIEAGCAVQNIGSIKVLEKVGMTREGRKRKVLPLKTGWTDNLWYAILANDKRAY